MFTPVYTVKQRDSTSSTVIGILESSSGDRPERYQTTWTAGMGSVAKGRAGGASYGRDACTTAPAVISPGDARQSGSVRPNSRGPTSIYTTSSRLNTCIWGNHTDPLCSRPVSQPSISVPSASNKQNPKGLN